MSTSTPQPLRAERGNVGHVTLQVLRETERNIRDIALHGSDDFATTIRCTEWLRQVQQAIELAERGA